MRGTWCCQLHRAGCSMTELILPKIAPNMRNGKYGKQRSFLYSLKFCARRASPCHPSAQEWECSQFLVCQASGESSNQCQGRRTTVQNQTTGSHSSFPWDPQLAVVNRGCPARRIKPGGCRSVCCWVLSLPSAIHSSGIF